MWIQQVLVHRISPFQDDNVHPIEFCRGFNLVRGANGVGKTTVLEATALVGHIPLFNVRVVRQSVLAQSHVHCKLVIEGSDIERMSRVLATLDELVNPESRFAESMRSAAVRTVLSEALSALRPDTVLSFGITIEEHDQRAPDLKDLLSREDRLAAEVALCVTDAQHALLLKFLVGISRPEVSQFAVDAQGAPDMKKPAGWFRSPRQALLERDGVDASEVPGFVGYFHTDMYRWGVGNDVRESPKELFHRTTALMIAERFRLFQCAGGAPNPAARHFSSVSELWGMIISPPDMRRPPDGHRPEQRRLSSVRLCEKAPGQRSVEVRISDHEVNIVSSGENQALFLLLWTISNAAYQSCLLIDEPEIHLSPGAASRTIEFLQALTRSRGNQVICATHAAVVPAGVRSGRNPRDRLIYLQGADQPPLEDEAAVAAISLDLQGTIDQLIAAMRPPGADVMRHVP
jgi:hypothetical protein